MYTSRMKFKEPKARTQPVRAVEVLSIPENQAQALDFDLNRDVLLEVWGKVEERINHFLQDPEKRFEGARGLCLLAIVNPKVADQLRRSATFKTAVIKLFKLFQPIIRSYGVEYLKFLADSLEVFPELRDARGQSTVRAKDLIADARLSFDNLAFPYWDGLVYTLRLYPEQREEILALAQEVKSDIKDIYLNRGHDLNHEGSLEGAAEYLASGLLLYPEEADYIRKEARGLWDNLLKATRTPDNPYLEECIFSATILSAEEAVIADDGSLRITLRAAQIAKRPGLPERSVA